MSLEFGRHSAAPKDVEGLIGLDARNPLHHLQAPEPGEQEEVSAFGELRRAEGVEWKLACGELAGAEQLGAELAQDPGQPLRFAASPAGTMSRSFVARTNP
jgi:hypothetical protein